MPWATWWRADPLPALSPLQTFSVSGEASTPLLARLAHRSEQEIITRLQTGHHPYLAFIADTPVGYGWVALQEGEIAELKFSFPIPARNAYLWDFLTLPAWRGRGLYPRLLQAILQQEQRVDRFWIGYEPGNDVSAHGIKKAGFHVIGNFVYAEGRVCGLALSGSPERAQACAAVFHLPIVDGT